MFNTFVSIIPLIVFSVIDEDYNPDFKEKDFNYIRFLMPDMYKQTRDSKPFNLVKYITSNLIALILSIVISLIFTNSFKDMIKNEKGDFSSIYELIFFTYLYVLIIHFFMIYIDTSLFNYIVVIFFLIQIFLDLIFIIVMNRIPNDNKLSGITSQLISLIHFLTLIICCSLICLPFYILRRLELFFGLNITNLIKNRNIQTMILGKIYKKKINQMIRAISAITKFKRIHEDIITNGLYKLKKKHKYENLVDIKMAKVVEHYENNKKSNKKKNIYEILIF